VNTDATEKRGFEGKQKQRDAANAFQVVVCGKLIVRSPFHFSESFPFPLSTIIIFIITESPEMCKNCVGLYV